MRVAAVTGSLGYIGRSLVPKLEDRGVTVKGIDKAAGSVSQNPRELYGLDIADNKNIGTVVEILRGCDCVVHLAAARSDWGLTQEEYYRDNCLATYNMLEAARRAQVKQWVYTGTVGIYGPGDSGVDESATFEPDTDYGNTKAEAERKILETATAEGWAVRSIRPSAVFSEKQPPDTNLYRLIEAIRRNRFMLIGDGSEIKTTSYLHNVVDAILWLFDGLDEGGIEVYNYVDEPRLTTRQIIDVIRDDLGTRLPLLRLPLAAVERPARVFDLVADRIGRDLPITAARIRKFCTPTNFDSSKIRNAGFEPRYASDQALRRTVRWHKGEAINDT